MRMHAGKDSKMKAAVFYGKGDIRVEAVSYTHLDVKLIKNAGGMIPGPFDSAVRSLLVGIVELGVEEVMVIGHNDCGVAHINADMMIRHLIQRGISQDHIDMMRYCGVDFEAWLRGFDCVEKSVAETVELLRNHPLMPADEMCIRDRRLVAEFDRIIIKKSAIIPKECAAYLRSSCASWIWLIIRIMIKLQVLGAL